MPQVQEIVVSAGRTFNHPFESYSNLKPSITVKATLNEGEDWEAATKQLQATAEGLIEDHKRHMLQTIEEVEELRRKGDEVARLDRQIRQAQERLDALRSGAPALESPQVEF